MTLTRNYSDSKVTGSTLAYTQSNSTGATDTNLLTVGAWNGLVSQEIPLRRPPCIVVFRFFAEDPGTLKVILESGEDSQEFIFSNDGAGENLAAETDHEFSLEVQAPADTDAGAFWRITEIVYDADTDVTLSVTEIDGPV